MRSRTEEVIKKKLSMNRIGAASGKGRDVGFEATNRSERRAKSDARRPSKSPRKSSSKSGRAKRRG